MKRCLQCAACFTSCHWRCPSCGWQAKMLDGRPAFAPELAQGGAGFYAEAFEELAGLEQGSFVTVARPEWR